MGKYKKKINNKSKKKGGYSRYRRYKAITSGFPKSKLVKMRYIEEITLNPGTAGVISRVYRANSVYDPYQGTGGGQPMSFDSWAAIYNKYTVVGSKCTVIPVLTATAQVNPAYFGVSLDTDPTNYSSVMSSVPQLLEQKYKDSTQIKQAGLVQSTGLNTKKNIAIKTFSPKKWFGVTNVMDGANHSALVTANPSSEAYFQVWAASINSNDPGSVNFLVTLEYIVLFRDPVIQVRS